MGKLEQQIALLLGVGLGQGAIADCDNDPANLMNMANCAFNSDIVGWTVSEGATAMHESMDGFPTADGSLQIDNMANSFVANSPCFSLAPAMGAPVNFGGRINQIFAGPGPGSCQVDLRTFTDTNCTMGAMLIPGDNGIEPVSVGTWNLLQDRVGSVSGTHAFLTFACSIAEAGSVTFRVDNAFLGAEPLVPVELQSFSID